MKPVKSKLSIVFLGTQMEIAGAQRLLLSQARWFQRSGNQVKVVFFYDKQGLIEEWRESNPFPVLSLEARNNNSVSIFNVARLFRACWRLLRLLRKNVDVVIAFTPHSNLLGLPLAWISGVPVRIGTHHGYIEGSSKGFALAHGLLSNSWICSKMVAVSAQVKEFAIRNEGVYPKKITVIENGIESKKSSVNTKLIRHKYRRKLNLNDTDILAITVGRLTVQKGYAILIDAISVVGPKFPRVHFVFAGDGPLRAELERNVEQLGITNSVIFLGIRKDVPELLLASDIFVQPSLWEGLSIALLEALAAGVPVVATSVEGVIDVVEDGKSALLVPAKDSLKLAATLERLITDRELRSRLSREGRERVEKHYSIDKMCNSYNELIHQYLPNGDKKKR
jgi:glycosyltransferase involved in cell wall biosynthesis